jgi:hypothetical protein
MIIMHEVTRAAQYSTITKSKRPNPGDTSNRNRQDDLSQIKSNRIIGIQKSCKGIANGLDNRIQSIDTCTLIS